MTKMDLVAIVKPITKDFLFVVCTNWIFLDWFWNFKLNKYYTMGNTTEKTIFEGNIGKKNK